MPVVSRLKKGIIRGHPSPGGATAVVLGNRRSTSLTLHQKKLRKTIQRRKTESSIRLRAGSTYVRSRETSHLNLLRKLNNARRQFETKGRISIRKSKFVQADSKVHFSNCIKKDTKLLPSTKVEVVISGVYKKRADLVAMKLRKGPRTGVVASTSSRKVEDDSDTDDTSEDTKDFTSEYSDDTDDENDEFEPVKSYPLRKKDRLSLNKSPAQEPSSVEESSCESLPDLDFPIAVRWTASDTTLGNKEKSTDETKINSGTVSNPSIRKRRLTDVAGYSQSKSRRKIMEDKHTRSASNVAKSRSLRSREVDRFSSPGVSSSWSSNKITKKLEARPTGSGSPKVSRSRSLQGVEEASTLLRSIDKKDQPKQSESTLQKCKTVVTAGPSHTTLGAEINFEAIPKRRGRGRPRKVPKIATESENESTKKSLDSASKNDNPLPKTRSQLKTTAKPTADELPKRQKQVTKFLNKTAPIGWNKKPKNVTAVRARYNKLIAKSKVWKSDRKRSSAGSLWTNKVTNSIAEVEKCTSLPSLPNPTQFSTPPTLSTYTAKSDVIKTDLKVSEKVIDKQKQFKAEAFKPPFLKKHVCNICNNMTFTRRYSLTKHLRTNQHKKMLERTSGQYINVDDSGELKTRTNQNVSLSKLNVHKKLPGIIPSSKFLHPKKLPSSGSIPSSKFLQPKKLPSSSISSSKFLQPKKLPSSGSISSSKFLQPKKLPSSGSISSSKFLQPKKLPSSGSIPSSKFLHPIEGTSDRKPDKILLIEGDGLKSECMVFGGADSNDKEKYIKVENDEKKSNSADESDGEEEESDDEQVETVQEYVTGKSLGKNNFVCLICQPNATFTRKVSFSVHLWNHRTDSDLKCQDCGMKFADSFSYNCHIDNTHADTTKYNCKYCKSKFSEMSYLEKHMNSHKRDLFERFICPQCDRRFTSHDLMARHFDYKHLAIDSRVQLIVDSSEDLDVHPKLPEFIICDNYSHNTNDTSIADMDLRDRDEVGDEMPDIDLELYDDSVDSISRRSSSEEHPSFMSEEYIANFPVEASQSYHPQHPAQRQHPINIVELDSPVKNNDGFTKFESGSVIFHNPILGCGYKVKTYKAAVSRSDSALTCVDCGKSFQNRRSLLKHVDYFTQVEKYSCTICKMKFKFKHHLHRHQLRHAPQKDSLMKANFSSGLKKPVFLKHRKLISRSLPKLLPVLPADSKSSHDKIKIFKTEAVQESQNYGDDHIPQVQNIRTSQSSELETLCPQTVIKCSDSSAHSSTTFSCNFENCSKRFTEQSTLKIHGWFHQNENLFSCSECDAKCERKSDLELHFKCHETQQPFFLCYVCFKPFRWKKDMVRHVRKKHPAERTYKCLYCAERTLFRQSEELTSHISKTHPEHRSFPCDYCGRRYAQRRYLLVHIQTQHEVEPDDGVQDPVVDEGGGDIYDGNFDEVEEVEYL